jgi:hypothetical protein
LPHSRASALTGRPGPVTRHKPANRPGTRRAAGSQRHAFITAALDAGVPLRDVQEAASHADPPTTIRYDRARGSLDRHATYIVAAYVAGAAGNPRGLGFFRLAAGQSGGRSRP